MLVSAALLPVILSALSELCPVLWYPAAACKNLLVMKLTAHSLDSKWYVSSDGIFYGLLLKMMVLVLILVFEELVVHI